MPFFGADVGIIPNLLLFVICLRVFRKKKDKSYLYLAFAGLAATIYLVLVMIILMHFYKPRYHQLLFLTIGHMGQIAYVAYYILLAATVVVVGARRK